MGPEALAVILAPHLTSDVKRIGRPGSPSARITTGPA
jgi:hypothetical protein